MAVFRYLLAAAIFFATPAGIAGVVIPPCSGADTSSESSLVCINNKSPLGDLEAVEYRVKIDSQIWTQPLGNVSTALVRFGRRDAFSLCGIAYRQRGGVAPLSHHLVCGQFITFVPSLPASSDEEMLVFAAVHESFHTLVQMQFERSRVDSFMALGGDASVDSIIEAMDMVEGWLARQGSRETASECQLIHADLSSASPAVLRVLLTVFQTEGTAEHYSREFLRRNGRGGLYERFRAEAEAALSHSNLPRTVAGSEAQWSRARRTYTVAADLVEAVDQRTDRRKWQMAYAQGAAIVDLYLQSRGCEISVGPSLMTRALRTPSLESVGLVAD